MICDFRRIFCPTLEEQKEDFERYKKLHDELAKKKGCSTCKYCVRVRHYPGFVTGEECECIAGLECDTVLFSVSNCPKWEEKPIFEKNEKGTSVFPYKEETEEERNHRLCRENYAAQMESLGYDADGNRK